MSTDDRRPSPADRGSAESVSPAAAQQQAEQDRLDEEAAHRLAEDPGDPKDRLSTTESDRLMEQQQERDIHA
jgi:hypothetical protein